ncbi:hypothetical protein Acr_27g0003350 [Actinidia rufa]|uniref:Uncharacterized protein n=1 Tax=Actinidia rufa TaxID=165716 RepID=A0A7J0H673_9ERIC|nr:hypothetical protein Acr_27g0003350 [Actinidia rufa]
MKLATKSRLRSPKESMVPGDNFRNHDLVGPFKVAENALHITSSEQPWSDIRLLYKSSYWSIRSSVDGVDLDVQISNLLRGGLVTCFDLIVSMETPPPSCPGWKWRDRLISGTGGAAGSGGLAATRSCIRRPLFSFMILIYSAMSCISRWRPSRSGTWLVLAIGWALLFGGLLELGFGDIIGKIAIWRVSHNCWCRGGEKSRDGRIDRILVEIDQAKYSTSPKGEEETTLWLWASSVEIAWRGSMLNIGLVLRRSRGFGDKHPLKRSWATSSVMVLGRRTCLSQ